MASAAVMTRLRAMVYFLGKVRATVLVAVSMTATLLAQHPLPAGVMGASPMDCVLSPIARRPVRQEGGAKPQPTPSSFTAPSRNSLEPRARTSYLRQAHGGR